MRLIFKYSFKINNMKFGVNASGVYRLPQQSGKRFYPLRKIKTMKKKGYEYYRCNRIEKSAKQIKGLIQSCPIITIELPDQSEMPF